MHKRNRHQGLYDLEGLSKVNEALRPFVFVNDFGRATIDFFDNEAVVELNKAILLKYYGLKYWSLPKGYLCPPIPGRADYIHHLADLLHVPKGPNVRVLDIGVGANAIYPIIGHREYGWSFVGSETDETAFHNALKIMEKNKGQIEQIEIRKQENTRCFFQGIIRPNEVFEFTMCNPPFYSSPKAAKAANRKKLRSLNPKSTRSKNFNFGGQANELWTPGGEEQFIHNMIHESRRFASSCYWFTSLVSKEAILQSVYKAFRKAKVEEYKTIEMTQGNKRSRFVAWTFLDEKQRKIWEVARLGR